MADKSKEDKSLQPQTYPKTHAKELYCLTDKDLESLTYQEKRNPYVRSSPPMKLYKQDELEEAAINRWGSLEAMEDEKQKRIAKKEKRAAEAQNDTSLDGEEGALRGEDGGHPAEPTEDRTTQNGALHPLISERIKKLGGKKGKKNGKFVLYWMSTAIRDHENPALDAALFEAKSRNLPLIIVSFLLASHTHPTHRRYKFILEGLKDIQASFRDKGILHCVYLEGVSDLAKECKSQPGYDAVLATAADADLVITELMPTPPYHEFTQRLVREKADHTEVWGVDTACIVPMTLIQKAYSAAYAYRSTTKKPRQERLANLPYPSTLGQGNNEIKEDLEKLVPWTSIDLVDKDNDILALLDKCDWLDRTALGIDHMPGGQVHGYKRWEAFKKTGLSSYAAKRNNPMLRSGVSRMSAYHHFGMVSPFRIARDANTSKGRGGDKFADEFMTWRELAYSFCYHNADKLETFQILPAWAQKTLTTHKGDKRDLKTIEQMEKGETGDVIWDALQYQLNVTGELHNNVRMTWGKAPLRWTPDGETALKTTIHLNHKYALDGCDPSSYGGILWCFGQFDGPKGAESTPIFGSLRNRPTHLLSKKINPERYRSLPVDGSGKAVDAEANGGKDIRSLFSQAGHISNDQENDDHSSDGHSDFEKGGPDDDATESPKSGRPSQKRKAIEASPKSPVSAKMSAAPGQKSSGKQAGIQKFFKKSKGNTSDVVEISE